MATRKDRPIAEDPPSSVPDNRAILRALSPTDFERLVVRLLWRWAFFNVQRIGGPGDRGRDLTGQTAEYPIPGRQVFRSWVVQCKHWRAVPSKTHLRDGLNAACAHSPDYYLLLGTFEMTAGLADWIEGIRPSYPFDLLVVCADDLEGWLAASPDICYDFLGGRAEALPYTALMESLIGELGARVLPGPDFLATLSLAMSLCRILRSPIVSSIHLLLALNVRQASLGNTVLERCGLRSGSLRTLVTQANRLSKGFEMEQRPDASPNVRMAMVEAGRLASSRSGPKLVDDIDLLAGIVKRHESMAAKILRIARVDLDRLCAHIASSQESSLRALRTPDLWNMSLGSDVRDSS